MFSFNETTILGPCLYSHEGGDTRNDLTGKNSQVAEAEGELTEGKKRESTASGLIYSSYF